MLRPLRKASCSACVHRPDDARFLNVEGEEIIKGDLDVSLFFQADIGFFVTITGIDRGGKRCYTGIWHNNPSHFRSIFSLGIKRIFSILDRRTSSLIDVIRCDGSTPIFYYLCFIMMLHASIIE